jgi:hypothetical protein
MHDELPRGYFFCCFFWLSLFQNIFKVKLDSKHSENLKIDTSEYRVQIRNNRPVGSFIKKQIFDICPVLLLLGVEMQEMP